MMPNRSSRILSELPLSQTHFNFTIPASTIIIGIADSSLESWYNSSSLFIQLPKQRPQPHTIPNSTPPGTTDTNISITTRMQNGTQAVLPNVFVKVYSYPSSGPFGDTNWQSAIDGYTDSSGHIQFNLVSLSGVTLKFSYVKPGWIPHSYFHDCTLGTCDVTEYMSPDIGPNPDIPTRVNITIQIKSGQDYSPVSGAYVSIGDSTAGTSYIAQNTNASGYAVFSNFPTSANIDGDVSKIGYQPLHFYVTSGDIPTSDINVVKYLYLTSSTVTPTITPVQQNLVTLTATPNSVNPGQQVSLAYTCANATACLGANGAKIVTYSEKYPDPSWDTHVIGIYRWNATTYGIIGLILVPHGKSDRLIPHPHKKHTRQSQG